MVSIGTTVLADGTAVKAQSQDDPIRGSAFCVVRCGASFSSSLADHLNLRVNLAPAQTKIPNRPCCKVQNLAVVRVADLLNGVANNAGAWASRVKLFI